MTGATQTTRTSCLAHRSPKEFTMKHHRLQLALVLPAALMLLAACADVSSNPAAPVTPTAAAPSQPSANLITLPVPSGFRQILSGTGIRVFRKDYAGGKPDFVIAVDLRSAYVANLTGFASGAPNGKISKRTMQQFWTDARTRNRTSRQARVVVNGTFFSTNDNPAPIAFGLKRDNVLLSYGYGVGNEYPGLIRTLSFSGDYRSASIQAYSRSTFTASPEVVGGLAVTASKSPTSYVPRTFVGVRDGTFDGAAETLLVFASSYARQADADRVLKGFGAYQTMMLDGGASGGLVIDGTAYYAGRTVPHAIALYAGK
jgi:hypothetical protein